MSVFSVKSVEREVAHSFKTCHFGRSFHHLGRYSFMVGVVRHLNNIKQRGV
jgi:hypothetical protein